jgi:hypothetical protein
VKRVRPSEMFIPIAAGCLLSLACSRSGLPSPRDAAASGGSVGAGGVATASGTGGTVGSGGGTWAGDGGASGGGHSGGGGKATGGATVVGGVTGTGGSIGTGGVTGAGGAGAVPGAGGIAGGTGGTGGAVGGATGTGSATGGATGTGGKGTGGATGTGGICTLPSAPNAPLITFNDNGSWFAYSDERAVVDIGASKLVVGSVASSGTRSGNIEAVMYDLTTGKVGAPAKLGNLPVDEYNAPAFVVRPDGKYLAAWAGHRTDCNSNFSVYDGSGWGAPLTFDWKTVGCPWNGDATHMITYTNLWYMGGQLFDFVRSVDTSPNALVSGDDGANWSYFGRLTMIPTTGYVTGYYRYWGNHTDRIDFLATEAHPRDFDNNLWHGYVQGGKLRDSAGTVVDDALAGSSDPSSAKPIDSYTKVFATGSKVGQVKLEHAWNHDIVRYDDGSIAILGQGRVVGSGTDDPDQRSFYGRWDGSQWTLTYLAKLGPKLNSSEQDYTGMGALHPDDPTTLFISTPYDPRDDTTKLSKHEIWRGTTCDQGATFQWTPVTSNSMKSNIRPIVPKWDARHTALIWLQGNFQSASTVTSAVVGIVIGP